MARTIRASLTLLASVASVSAGQVREMQRHDFDDPEGRLMAFYAAALASSAIGPGVAEAPWAVRAGIELSHIPRLSRRQRTAGFDKPEASNLSPVLPRARIALSTPGGVRVEASWLPPIAVFDARASLYSIAVSGPLARRGSMVFTPRLAAAGGRARGAITCNDDLAQGTSSEQVYYRAVCHSRQSEDYFDPRQLSAEIIASRSGPSRLVPFASLGVRHDDTRFDIGVRRQDGTRDSDHPVLLMRSTRPFATGGVMWHGRADVGAEIYYAPGSLLTVRVRADLPVLRGRGPNGAR